MVIATGNLLFTMLKEDCMTDVTFIVSGNETRAHGVVAACRGGELKRMLMEKKDRIEIGGITLQTFNTVLEYLYTGKVKISDSNVFHLMHAAQELELVCLQSECAKFLQKKLTTENFAAHATEAVNLGIKEFIKVVVEYFGQNTSVLLKEVAGVFGCPQGVLRVLCGSEEINCSEVELFLCCIEWAKRECQKKKMAESPENIRQLLGGILDNIRFSTMEYSDFQTVVIPLKILSFEEIGRIMVAKGTEKARGSKYESGAGPEVAAMKKTQMVKKKTKVAETQDTVVKEVKMVPDTGDQCVTAQCDQNLGKNVASGEYVKEYFMLHTSEFLKSEKFKKLSLEALVDVYSAEIIECQELDLFTAAMEWEKINKPSKQDFMRVLNQIRFPIMPMKDFIKKVVPEKILTDKQIGRVIVEMQTGEKASHYSNKCRAEIWVNVESYRWSKGNERPATRLRLAKSTTIKELKGMKIFNGGKERCSPHSFTLRRAIMTEQLQDDEALGSIHTGAKDLELRFNSCSYITGNVYDSKFMENVAFEKFTNDNSFACWLDVISDKKRVNGHAFKYPGDTIEIEKSDSKVKKKK